MSSGSNSSTGSVLKTSIDYSRLDGTIYSCKHVRDLIAVVVGAGALGNEVVKSLGLLGVGELIIIDPDVVEASNLTRSVLFRTAGWVGQNKAQAMIAAAQPLFPDTSFKALPVEIADVGLAELARANLLFSCVHSDLARLEIAYLCTKLQIGSCDAGLGGNNHLHGRVTWFPGKSAACFSCMLPAGRRRSLLTNWDLSATKCYESDASSSFPSTPTMAAIVGSLQVEFGLRKYLDRSRKARSLEIELDDRFQLQQVSVDKSVLCPFHWREPGKEQLHPVPPPPTVIGDWLTGLQAKAHARNALWLDWPICVRARCLDCSFIWQPMLRIASFRRNTCPRCQARSLLGMECLQSIDAESDWAANCFSELSLPDNHLLTTRFIG